VAAHVTIDPELCIGSGECVRLRPESFQIDEQSGVAVPLPGSVSVDPSLLVLAAQACPTQAIRVETDDGTVLYEA
jgi:ferredoxin